MRFVLVIGGTKGVGAATARRFAEAETTLLLNYCSDEAAAEAAAADVSALGSPVHLLQADIATEAGVETLFARIGAITSRIDVLVHCAAVVDRGSILEQDPSRFERSLRIGGLSLFHLIRHASPVLGQGSAVIFLSGNAVDLVLPNHGGLAAGKALGECLVRYLAIECAPRGISFNTLRVGPIDTGLFREAVGSTPEKVILPPTTPAGRRLTVDDAAEAVHFLASPQATMVRGQTLMVDGGLSKTVR